MRKGVPDCGCEHRRGIFVGFIGIKHFFVLPNQHFVVLLHRIEAANPGSGAWVSGFAEMKQGNT